MDAFLSSLLSPTLWLNVLVCFVLMLQALEAAADAWWTETKPKRVELGIVDDEDSGALVPITVDVVLSEKVEA